MQPGYLESATPDVAGVVSVADTNYGSCNR
jgi:hypothetical protein